MNPRCKQALAIYLDTLHCGDEDLLQVMGHFFSFHSHLCGSAGSSFGIQECYQHMNIFKGAFPDLTIVEVEAAETKKHGILMPWKVVGTHEDYFFDTAPTGRRVEYSGYTSISTTPDGKVAKWEYQMDLLEIFRQIGRSISKFMSNKEALILELQKLDTDHPILTVKQTECLAFLCQGLSSKYIAQKMGCSYKTVECHTQTIKEKIGCHYKEQLIEAIRDKGLYFIFRDLFDMLYIDGS